MVASLHFNYTNVANSSASNEDLSLKTAYSKENICENTSHTSLKEKAFIQLNPNIKKISVTIKSIFNNFLNNNALVDISNINNFKDKEKVNLVNLIDNELEFKLANNNSDLKIYHNNEYRFTLIPNITKDKITYSKSINWIVYDKNIKAISDKSILKTTSAIAKNPSYINAFSQELDKIFFANSSYPQEKPFLAFEQKLKTTSTQNIPQKKDIYFSLAEALQFVQLDYQNNEKATTLNILEKPRLNLIPRLSFKSSNTIFSQIKNLQTSLNKNFIPTNLSLSKSKLNSSDETLINKDNTSFNLLQAISSIYNMEAKIFALKYPNVARKAIKPLNKNFNIKKLFQAIDESTQVFDLNGIFRHENQENTAKRKNGKHMLNLLQENVKQKDNILLEIKPKYVNTTNYLSDALTPYNTSILKSVPKSLVQNTYTSKFILLKNINDIWYEYTINNSQNNNFKVISKEIKDNNIHNYLKNSVQENTINLYAKPAKNQLNRNELRCKYRKNAGASINILHEKKLMHEMSWENSAYKVFKNNKQDIKFTRSEYAKLSAYKAIQKRNQVFAYKRDIKAKRKPLARFASSYLNPFSTENLKPWEYGNNYNNASYAGEDKTRRFVGNFLGGMTQPQDTSIAHLGRTFANSPVFGDFTTQLGLSVVLDASAQLFADSVQGLAYNAKHNYRDFWGDATAQNISELTSSMQNITKKMQNNLSLLENIHKLKNYNGQLQFNNKIYSLEKNPQENIDQIKQDIFLELCKDLQQTAIYMLRHKAQHKQTIGIAVLDQFLQNIVRTAWVATIVINPAMKGANLLPGIARLDLLVRRLIQTPAAGLDNNLRQKYLERTNVNNPHYIMSDIAITYGLDKLVGQRDSQQFEVEVIKSMLVETSNQNEFSQFEQKICELIKDNLSLFNLEQYPELINLFNNLDSNKLNNSQLKTELIHFSLNNFKTIVNLIQKNNKDFQPLLANFVFDAEKIHSSISYNASRRTDIVANYISYQLTDYRLVQNYYEQKIVKLQKKCINHEITYQEKSIQEQDIQQKLTINNQHINQLKQESILFYQGLEYINAHKTNPPSQVNLEYKHAWTTLERNFPNSKISQLLQSKKPLRAVLHNLKFVFKNTNDFFLHSMFRSSNWVIMGIDEIGDAIAQQSEKLGTDTQAQSIVLAAVYSLGFSSLVLGGINSYLDHIATFGRPVGHKTYIMAFIKKLELEISDLQKTYTQTNDKQKQIIDKAIKQASILQNYLTNDIEPQYAIKNIINIQDSTQQNKEIQNILLTSVASLIPANANNSSLAKLKALREETKHIEKAYKIANNWYRQESIISPIIDRLKKSFAKPLDYNSISNNVNLTITKLENYVNLDFTNFNNKDSNAYTLLIEELYTKVKSNAHKNNHLLLRIEFIKKMQMIKTSVEEEIIILSQIPSVQNQSTINNLKDLQLALKNFLHNIYAKDKTLISMNEEIYLQDVEIKQGKILSTNISSIQQTQDTQVKNDKTAINLNLHEIRLHDMENYDETLTKPSSNIFKRSLNIAKRGSNFIFKHILNPFSRTSVGKHLNPLHKEFLPYYILRQGIIPIVMIYKNLTKTSKAKKMNTMAQNIVQDSNMKNIAEQKLNTLAYQINNPDTDEKIINNLKKEWLSIYNNITHTHDYVEANLIHTNFIQSIVYQPLFSPISIAT